MRIYEVFRGRERHAQLQVHDDGQPVWTFGAAGQEAQIGRALQEEIEAAVEQQPDAPRLQCQDWLICRRDPSGDATAGSETLL
ncbi:MAG: hypothetical protein AB7N91_22865 [Candidatus Tectimicrobiota bacterium]